VPGRNPQKRGAARTLPNFCVVLCIFVLFYVFLCCSMYCLFRDVLCIVCVYMCTVLPPPGGYPIAVKYIISYQKNYLLVALAERQWWGKNHTNYQREDFPNIYYNLLLNSNERLGVNIKLTPHKALTNSTKTSPISSGNWRPTLNCSTWHNGVLYNKVKVKVTLVRALRLCTGRTAHRGNRGIALLFHDQRH